MAIIFAGNICNFAYWFAKWGRELGFDTHALIESDTPHPAQMPSWEDPSYDPDNPPSWVHFFRVGSAVDRALHGRADDTIGESLKSFDGVHTLSVSAAIAVDSVGRIDIHHVQGSFSRSSRWARDIPMRKIVSPKRVPSVFRFRRAMDHAQTILVSQTTDAKEILSSTFGKKLSRGSSPL